MYRVAVRARLARRASAARPRLAPWVASTVLAAAGALAAAPLPAAAAPAGPQVPGPGGPEVAAWGSNLRGQLGTGTTRDALRPVLARLPHRTRITQVATGCEYTLALTAGGRVLSWGENDFGQLGNGTIRRALTPAPVKLPAGVRVTAIAAGCEFSLAVTTDGHVLAWGSNDGGTLGTGEDDEDPGRLPVRVHLPAGVRVRAVAGGTAHALALTTGGQVYAWGDNSTGALGNGTTALEDPVPGLVHLPAGTRVTAVAAGDSDSLAVTARGRVLGWGLETRGSLGNGRGRGRATTPVAVHLPAGVRVRRVFAGGQHALALTATGSVLGWGDNQFGQVSAGLKTGALLVPVRVPLPRGTRVTALGGGIWHSLALTRRGQVLAWGDNRSGALGNGTRRRSAMPVLVQLPARAIAISSGAQGGSSLAVLAR